MGFEGGESALPVGPVSRGAGGALPHARRRPAATLLLLLLAVSGRPARGQPGERGPVIIAQIVDGESEALARLDAMIREEVTALLEGEIEVRFPPDKRRHGGWSADGIRSALDEMLADESVDLVIANGAASAQVVVGHGAPAKPVIAPLGIDASIQGLPSAEGVSGIPNLSYLARANPVESDLRLFSEVTPFARLAVLINRSLFDMLAAAAPRLEEMLRYVGVETRTQIIPVGRSVDEALERIEPTVDAVYLTPLLHLPEAEVRRLLAGLTARRLPSFSLLGHPEVELGALAGQRTDDWRRLARRVALHVQRILAGEDAGTLPVPFVTRDQLVINMATVRAVERYPTFSVLAEAVLLHQDVTEVERELSLESAVEEAIAVNLDLRAAERFVAAAEEDVDRARSRLLPQLDATALGVQIDEDRASPLSGAERALSASVGVEQILYSETAAANLAIQKSLQLSRQEELEQLRLDIAEEAATTYLNVLRAKTFERIQRQNLRLARENLGLAQVRVEIGTASRAEVFRWETEINNARIAVLDAGAARVQAELALNRLLHRPLDEPLHTFDPGLEEEAEERAREIERYIDNPGSFAHFSDFMVGWGLERAPEMRAIDAAVAAQERALLAARRAFWLPDLALAAELEEVLEESGAGSDSALDLPGIPLPGDTRWSLAVQARLPLFVGGARAAERAQAEIGLSGLDLERSALAERLELRIRTTLVAVRTSFSAIDLARRASAAARRNLELVTDAYTRGALDVLDLLDAQNASLLAEASSSNAVYDFFLDFVAALRAVNNYIFVETDPEWLAAMSEYFRRVEPNR